MTWKGNQIVCKRISKVDINNTRVCKELKLSTRIRTVYEIYSKVQLRVFDEDDRIINVHHSN